MIVEGIRDEEDKSPVEVIQLVPVILLSIATSIDALAVGVSSGVLQTAVHFPALVIGAVAFVVSCAGVLPGKRLDEVPVTRTGITGGGSSASLGSGSLSGTVPAEQPAACIKKAFAVSFENDTRVSAVRVRREQFHGERRDKSTGPF
ncbi:MAG: manganese efflux pump [Methanoregula sp.]|nr:manganese efflux pump [Methanoregula sp.]